MRTVSTRLIRVEEVAQRATLPPAHLDPWSKEMKSLALEPLLAGTFHIINEPLGVFVHPTGAWELSSGLRLGRALKEFLLEGTLRLEGLLTLPTLEGLTSEEIPLAYLRRLLDTNLLVTLVEDF